MSGGSPARALTRAWRDKVRVKVIGAWTGLRLLTQAVHVSPFARRIVGRLAVCNACARKGVRTHTQKGERQLRAKSGEEDRRRHGWGSTYLNHRGIVSLQARAERMAECVQAVPADPVYEPTLRRTAVGSCGQGRACEARRGEARGREARAGGSERGVPRSAALDTLRKRIKVCEDKVQPLRTDEPHQPIHQLQTRNTPHGRWADEPRHRLRRLHTRPPASSLKRLTAVLPRIYCSAHARCRMRAWPTLGVAWTPRTCNAALGTHSASPCVERPQHVGTDSSASRAQMPRRWAEGWAGGRAGMLQADAECWAAQHKAETSAGAQGRAHRPRPAISVYPHPRPLPTHAPPPAALLPERESARSCRCAGRTCNERCCTRERVRRDWTTSMPGLTGPHPCRD